MRVVAGLLSATLHVVVFFVIASSAGRQDGAGEGDTPVTQVVLLESRSADRADGIKLAALDTAAAPPNVPGRLDPDSIQPPALLLPDDDTHSDDFDGMPPVEVIALGKTVLTSTVDPLSTFVMPQAQTSGLLERIERLAEELARDPRAQVTWNEDGRQFSAEFVLERARNGVELDRVIAEVSAEDEGRLLRTRVMLKRLPFSHFTQIVDRWDPMMQLHDDEIVGRMHINSRFNVLYDSQARPKLLGKVSTAAGSFDMESTGRRRKADVFLEGIETRAGRIALPERVHPFAWAPRDANARVHKLGNDTGIRFLADGSYVLRNRDSDTTQYHDGAAGHPVYFIAARGVTLYVHGVVAGKVLVYSPQRIVVEGSLTYAHDPREDPDSGDYLGLVCDRDIEVAPPRVTGPGDLHIQGALFAKRRFVVTDIDHARTATLRIYGSVAAGSLTASEPRYATKVEYDGRFDQLRPPGFPSTNRFAAEDWDGRWTEMPEQSASDSF